MYDAWVHNICTCSDVFSYSFLLSNPDSLDRREKVQDMAGPAAQHCASLKNHIMLWYIMYSCVGVLPFLIGQSLPKCTYMYTMYVELAVHYNTIRQGRILFSLALCPQKRGKVWSIWWCHMDVVWTDLVVVWASWLHCACCPHTRAATCVQTATRSVQTTSMWHHQSTRPSPFSACNIEKTGITLGMRLGFTG
jgi:hypothetical protein